MDPKRTRPDGPLVFEDEHEYIETDEGDDRPRFIKRSRWGELDL